MTKVLYHRIFTPKAFGHGGDRRAAQLQELYDAKGIQIDNYRLGQGKGKHWWFAVRAVIASHGWRVLMQSPRYLYHYLRGIACNIDTFREFVGQPECLMLWESTIDFNYFMPWLAKKYDKRIIALPHNLESLVPNRKSLVDGSFAPIGFQKEIKVMCKCDAVFTISREEEWLLCLFGVNAHYLPYYPPKAVQTDMLAIREKRKSGNAIFMMGSALNKPTAQGMRTMIDFWTAHPELPELRIGGYATQTLQADAANITIVGEMSQERLQEEMIIAKAMLIHQPPTTGALTRIVEALLAGIPVIVNAAGARSYWGADGLYVYDNIEQLPALLTQDFAMPVVPAEPDYTEFLEIINTLCKQ